MNTQPTPEAVEEAMEAQRFDWRGWGMEPDRYGEWVEQYQHARLAAEVKRLRALVHEQHGKPPFVPGCDIFMYPGVFGKQIKPGPILDIPLDGAMQCTKCGTPDKASLWFKHGYSPACPHCGAEYVCNAGRGYE